MPLENLDDLDASWAIFLEERNLAGKLTQAGSWRKSNPGEWDALLAYRQRTAVRPNLGSQLGRLMVEETDAWHEARAEVLPPPPPAAGQLLFNGDWSTGDFSQWKENTSIDQGAVVSTPYGRMFRARTGAQKGASICHVGNQFGDYQLSFEVIPADVWFGIDVVVPDGKDPNYPGVLEPATPGSGWNIVWEVHNRTDPQSGYDYPARTPGSYVSTVLTVKSELGSPNPIRWQLRMSGGTLMAPVHVYNEVAELIVPNRVYKHRIRKKNGHTTATGYFEWWVDGVRIAADATPTAYLCEDGLSGERLQVGLYRGEVFSQAGTIYVGGAKAGTTRESVGG